MIFDKIKDKINEEYVKREANKTRPEDVTETLDNQKQIDHKMSTAGLLEKYAESSDFSDSELLLPVLSNQKMNDDWNDTHTRSHSKRPHGNGTTTHSDKPNSNHSGRNKAK